jgi:hypothetical protein
MSVSRVELLKIAGHALLDLRPAPLHLRPRDVLVAVVHRLELAAVDRQARGLEKTQLTAECNEPCADLSNTLKSWMGATHFLTKGLKTTAAEMALHVLVYNMKRVIGILGVQPLLTGIRL